MQTKINELVEFWAELIASGEYKTREGATHTSSKPWLGFRMAWMSGWPSKARWLEQAAGRKVWSGDWPRFIRSRISRRSRGKKNCRFNERKFGGC